MKWEEWNLLTGLLFMLMREVTTSLGWDRVGDKVENSNSATGLGWSPALLGSQRRKAMLPTSVNMLASIHTVANPARKLRLSTR